MKSRIVAIFSLVLVATSLRAACPNERPFPSNEHKAHTEKDTLSTASKDARSAVGDEYGSIFAASKSWALSDKSGVGRMDIHQGNQPEPGQAPRYLAYLANTILTVVQAKDSDGKMHCYIVVQGYANSYSSRTTGEGQTLEITPIRRLSNGDIARLTAPVKTTFTVREDDHNKAFIATVELPKDVYRLIQGAEVNIPSNVWIRCN